MMSTATRYEFGQPDTNYDGPKSLIIAVNAYPSRFSPETNAVVKQFIAKELSLAIPPNTDTVQ